MWWSESAFAAVMSKGWLFFAALIGSVTGAYMLGNRTRTEYAFAVGIGFFAAIFLAPAIIAWKLPNAPADSPLVGMVYYLVSVGTMFFLPPFLAFVAKVAADPVGWWRGLKRD